MRINHNIAALNTYGKLSSNQATTSKSLEKLSSGLRINRAGDDAAGLAISEKMRSQIRGLDTASRNSNDGISLIQTAEGALNETHSILQRMKELAVQSANDTNTNEDRAEIQKEIKQLTTEITRIAKDTEFNTKKLLDGSMGSTATMGGALGTAGVTATVAAGTPPLEGTYNVSITRTAPEAESDLAATAYTGTITGTITFNGTDWDNADGAGNAGALPANLTISGTPRVGDKIALQAAVTPEGTFTNTNFTTAPTFTEANIAVGVATGSYAFTYTHATTSWTMSVDGGAATAFDPANFGDYGLTAPVAVAGDDGDGFTVAVTTAKALASAIVTKAPATTTSTISASITDSNGNAVSASTFDFKNIDSLTSGVATTGTISVDNRNASIFQIGANAGQNTMLSINNMDAESLGVDALDLTTQKTADAAISTIDSAISTVSSQRAALGAMQNRLDHTINNLATASENLTAAESRIRDVDMAKEMMEFTKNNILSQASQAMLAQANQQPQSVLQLLQ
jgi:flagellin